MQRRIPQTIVLSSLILHAGIVAAQPTLDWVTSIATTGQFTVVDTATDSSGATFIAATQDFTNVTLIRINTDGSTAWTQTYSGPGGQDVAEAVTLSLDESAIYLLARSSVPDSLSDYAVLKYDAQTGDSLWTRLIDGGDQGIDSPSDIAAMPDGGAVVTGGFDTPDEQRDFGTARLDADGNVLWTRIYTGFGQFLFENDDAEYVAVDGSGDVVISGNAMAGSDSDIVTIKYDGDTGATIWEARYEGGNNDAASGLAFAPNGDIVVLGIDSLTSGPRWVLASYDPQTGAELWSLIQGFGLDNFARHLAIDSDGTVYATGLFDPDNNSSNGNDQLVAIAVDGQSGAVLWERSFGDTGAGDGDFGQRIYPDNSGSVWVVGGTSSDSIVGDPLERDGLLLELAADTGDVRSVTTLDTSTDTLVNRDALRHMGVDSTGRLYVVGNVTGDSAALLSARYTLTDLLVGDVNCDGSINLLDVGPFVDVLSTGTFDSKADINQDGVVDLLDVQPFVDLLTGP